MLQLFVSSKVIIKPKNSNKIELCSFMVTVEPDILCDKNARCLFRDIRHQQTIILFDMLLS